MGLKSFIAKVTQVGHRKQSQLTCHTVSRYTEVL